MTKTILFAMCVTAASAACGKGGGDRGKAAPGVLTPAALDALAKQADHQKLDAAAALAKKTFGAPRRIDDREVLFVAYDDTACHELTLTKHDDGTVRAYVEDFAPTDTMHKTCVKLAQLPDAE